MTVTLAFYKGNAKTKHKAIALFTRGGYSHVVFVIKMYKSTMDCIASSRVHNGSKRVLLPYNKREWDLVEVDIDHQSVLDVLSSKLNKRYSYRKLIISGLFQLPFEAEHEDTCSSLIASGLGLRCPSTHTPNSIYRSVKLLNQYKKSKGLKRLLIKLRCLL